MLIFRDANWPEHRPWFLVTVSAAAGAIIWYAVASINAGTLLGGGSFPGLSFGVVGGLIVVFEILLSPRKKKRAWRVGRAVLWMKGHIWLGLLCLVLIVFHSGFRWMPGSLSGVLMFLFLAVCISGIWGLILQQFLPKMMLESVPAETIHSQIDRVLEQLLEETGQLVGVTCGREEVEVVVGSPAATAGKPYTVIGSIRATGPFQGKTLQTKIQARRLPDSEPLLELFDTMVEPYLRARSGSALPLASAKYSQVVFQKTRTRVNPEAHGVVDLLEGACDQRRQFDIQSRLNRWLHSWLLVHVPLSFAMFILMIAHVWYAFRYY